MELVCDRVAILQRGEMIRSGTVAELTRQEGRFEIGLAEGNVFPKEDVEQLGLKVEAVGGRTEVLIGTEPNAIDPVLALLHAKGLRLRYLMEKKQTLEDVFISTVDQAEPGTERRRPVKARKIAQ